MGLTNFQQNTAGIAQPSPAGLAPIPGPYTNQYKHADISYDYAIGGIPFLAGEGGRGTYFRRIYTRTFSPIRKDQFDNQQAPGEQSIWGWWLRSQSAFAGGAGVQFLDTVVDPTYSQRYFYSENLDMLSTPGQATLLQQTGLETGISTVGPVKLRSANNGPGATAGRDGVLVLDVGASTLKFFSTNGGIGTYTMPGGLTGLANTLTDDGTNYYFADKTGIYKGTISSSAAATKIWNVPSTSGNYVLGWVKGRLVAGLDNNVYELVGGSPPTLPTPKFTHQNASYVFTDISETGTAILVSGNAGGAVSQIHKFTLDTGGAMPVLTSGIVAAQMPFGEKILSMYAYVGTYVGIGTNKGFRVAQTDINGNLSYGPLVVQDPANVGVQAIAGYDRFLFIGNQGNKLVPQAGWVNPPDAAVTDALMRVDLSQQTSTGSQPFCNDSMPWSPTGGPNSTGAFYAPTGSAVNSIANMGQSGLIAWSTGSSVYTNRAAQKMPSGFLYTSKIRFNTLEPKHFKYVYLRHQNITDGSIDISGQNPNMQLATIAPGIVGSSVVGATSPFFISDFGNSQEWFQLKFTLHAGTANPNYSPILNGYQLRGLPGVSRQVLIEVPLLCFDHEDDHFGNPHGSDGFAYQRLKAIEALTASGNIVLFQDLNYNDASLVIVDDYKFEQQSPELAKAASKNNMNSNAHGGYLILVCRVVA